MSHSSFRRIGEDRKRDDVTLLVEGETTSHPLVGYIVS